MARETILIVEDNPLNMELARDLLELAGFGVRQAVDARTGRELARTSAPDLILLDIGLPDLDGLTLARELRQDETTRGIPIVILTAHAMKGDEERAYRAGCAGYVTKPIDTKTFAPAIARFLRAE